MKRAYHVCFLLAVLSLFTPALFASVATCTRAIFTGETASQTDLYLLDITSLKSTPITTAPSNESQAAVSPDGKYVAFISDKSGAPSLYLLDLDTPTASWSELGIGMGLYTNPTFSPDGKMIAAGYAPDPQTPFAKTQLVSIDIAAHSQKVLLDSAKWRPDTASGESSVSVVDRPLWIDANSLVFVEIEYSTSDPVRIITSGLHTLSLIDGKTQRLVGGESGFDSEGRARGFRASIPARFDTTISFAAIQGSVDRVPMTINPDGRQRKAIVEMSDPDFFGPLLRINRGYLYSWQDGDGILHLAVWHDKKKEREPVPFAGSAREPAIIP
ncbi:MAG: PD40 domain-containing protein [Candidatus Riflebacteria bacterium]|nr:PD40 domain-containing protein [Candidatus Riflebacteria bacterium]